MFIKQISVFMENKVGELRAVSRLLGEARIDMLAEIEKTPTLAAAE